MDQNETTYPRRRDALRLGLFAGAGIAMAGASRSALLPPTKLSKESVKYTDAGKVAGKDCDDCSQYLPGRTAQDLGSCKVVEGAINPHGHCIAFSPMPKR